MKRFGFVLVGLMALFTLTQVPQRALAVPFPIEGEGQVDPASEQVYQQGAPLDAVIADVDANQKMNKVNQWMHQHDFRRISGNLASHNVTSNGGATRTSMIPFKNDVTHHGAIAVQVKVTDGNGQPTERWLIWEFWRTGNGDEVDGATYFLNGNNFDPDTQPNRTFRQFANCVTGSCGTAAGGCFIGNIIDAETGFAPCYVSWCGGAIGGCALLSLFG